MWFETTYRCPRCGSPLVYIERRGSAALRCPACGVRVWTDARTAARFASGGRLEWQRFMELLYAAYAYRLAMKA
ncbi:zf-TFIIB domain-containing protein [Thermoproteus uzoniensis]|uniref:zf-TFIIB domain-containing protein n=1 Tax=Thermoproteus uzoniensis TaxID=184117 RepID=UPI0011E548EA|nr:zf-TFIIB domain-containing protein [Thermoproteus uzoniensis]